MKVFAQAFQDINFDPVEYNRTKLFEQLESIQVPQFSDEGMSLRNLDENDIPLISNLKDYSIKHLSNHFDQIDKHKLNK